MTASDAWPCFAWQVLILELFNYNDTILDFLRFSFMVTAITHWLACGWRMVAGDYMAGGHVNWITESSYIDPFSCVAPPWLGLARVRVRVRARV